MNKLFSGSGCIGLLAVSLVLNAQEPSIRSHPGPTIHPDHTVTFTFKAPDAKSVVLEGNWPGGSAHTSLPMVKDENGVWTVTTGPIAADLWTYSFNRDGMRVPDPRNGHTAGGGSALLIVGPAGSESYNLELHDVPHGTVAAMWYPAPKLQLTSKYVLVYLPPGYETSHGRYPALYLTGNESDSYVRGIRAPNILDNLIAEGKAKPMIMVMASTVPDLAAPEAMVDEPLPQTIGRPSRFAKEPTSHGDMRSMPPWLDGATSIATDLVAFIDKSFRTIGDREHRAIVGTSGAGAAAFYAAATNVKTFAWIGGFSIGWPAVPGVRIEVPLPENSATRFPFQTIVAPFGGPDMRQNIDIDKFAPMVPDLNAKANLHPIYLYQGVNDPLIEALPKVEKLLDSRGVKYVSVVMPNYGHEGRFWSWTLNDFAQHIFRSQPK